MKMEDRAMMKYPIGVQSFEQIREDGFAYVDKTDLIYMLTHEGKRRTFLLDLPNNEVQKGFVSLIASDYFQDRRTVHCIGVSFSSETGTVGEWKCKLLTNVK